MSKVILWNHFDDWANVVLVIGQFVLFFLFLAFLSRNVTISTEVVPYNLAEATRVGNSCRLRNFNPHCVSGFASFVEMRCSGCAAPFGAPNDVFEFKYVWFNSGYSTTTCRNKILGSTFANIACDMAKWDDPAFSSSNRQANVWSFSFNLNKNLTVSFGGAQSFDIVVPTSQATSYPLTPWHVFNVELIDSLSRYQQLGGLLISAADNFNPESISAQVAPLEVRLAGKGSSVVGRPNYDRDISKAIATCNSGLMMECQSLVPEPTLDFMLRLFGYTVFLQILVSLVILGQHAVKKARTTKARTSGLQENLLQSSYSTF